MGAILSSRRGALCVARAVCRSALWSFAPPSMANFSSAHAKATWICLRAVPAIFLSWCASLRVSNRLYCEEVGIDEELLSRYALVSESLAREDARVRDKLPPRTVLRTIDGSVSCPSISLSASSSNYFSAQRSLRWHLRLPSNGSSRVGRAVGPLAGDISKHDNQLGHRVHIRGTSMERLITIVLCCPSAHCLSADVFQYNSCQLARRAHCCDITRP